MNTDVRLTKPTTEIWESTLALLSKKLNQPSFESWIRPLVLQSFMDGSAKLVVSNDFVRTMILNNYSRAIAEAMTEVVGTTVYIEVVVDDTIAQSEYTGTIASIPASIVTEPAPQKPVLQTAARAAAPASQGLVGSIDLKQRSNLNPKYTFDTFVVGSHNRFCHSAAAAVAQRPGQSYNPLFIYGGVGLGKTHLMQAIGHAVLDHSPQLSVKYISCERFTNDLINSIRDDRMIDFRKRYRQVDVLLVDDIQFIEGKESTQEEFFHTFNALRDSGRQIVLTSDRPPKALSKLEERLRSRFEWGLISDIQVPDIETRMAILRKKCESEGIAVDESVIEHIASTFTTNIRELEGALIRVHAYNSLTGGKTNIGELTNVLQPAAPSSRQGMLTLDQVIETVASSYRVEPGQLRSSRRSQDLTLPRHIAMYLAYELLQLSYPRIGEAFGNRKHTSVLYAHSRIKKLITEDTRVATSVAQLRQQLS